MRRTALFVVALIAVTAMTRGARADACCLADGQCLDGLPEAFCDALGGAFDGQSDCASSSCAGACHLSDGTCVDALTALECQGLGGTWSGLNTFCPPPPNPGACCLFDGSCVDGQLPDECDDLGGTFSGAGTVCGAACEALGACCIYETAECIENVSQLDCEVKSKFGTGEWHAGVTCADVSCPIFGFGACCLPSGECWEFVEESECFGALGGTYLGDNESCGGGACCEGDVDGDGVVDFGDVLNVLSNWGLCTGCPADLDHSTIVGFRDLIIVLSNYGSCG